MKLALKIILLKILIFNTAFTSATDLNDKKDKGLDKFEKLSWTLNLNDAQQEELKKILETHRQKMDSLQEETDSLMSQVLTTDQLNKFKSMH